jgi:hypothetical protein
MAKAQPINRNQVRGSVWGLTLGNKPPKPKKKK